MAELAVLEAANTSLPFVRVDVRRLQSMEFPESRPLMPDLETLAWNLAASPSRRRTRGRSRWKSN